MVFVLAAAMLQEWLGTSYNGLWIDHLGEVFVVDAPYAIWGTFDGRHYCAYNVRQADKTEYYGDFQDSRDMVTGWTSNPPLDGQETAQRSLMQDFPYDASQSPPPEIPYIPAPKDPADSGHLKVDLGANHSTLNLVWRASDNKLVYSDSIFFVGKASAISMNGSYKAGDLVFSVSEVGSTARRTFDGLVQINGKRYTLRGNLAWTRGSFTLSASPDPAVVGRGWIEWLPTSTFGRSLLKGHTGPTDQIEVYIDLVSGEYPDGIHKLLAKE
jgi:hypothetical protein